MTMEMSGKTAFVTGSSRGIGRAIAERFAAAGALVAVHCASNRAAADETLGAIADAGGQAFLVQAEFGKPDAIVQAVDDLRAGLVERTGSDALDILVNNAGGSGYKNVAEMTEEFYDYTFDLNTRTPFFLTQALLPSLRAGGSVINISSEAARINLVETVSYGMAKAALEHFTRCLAKEIGPRDIRVNAVAPGIIRTAQSEDYLSIPEQHDAIVNTVPLRRIGHVSDMAEMVFALAMKAGRYSTGQVVEVSGGYLL